MKRSPLAAVMGYTYCCAERAALAGHSMTTAAAQLLPESLVLPDTICPAKSAEHAEGRTFCCQMYVLLSLQWQGAGYLLEATCRMYVRVR